MRPPPDRSSIDEISEMGTLEPSARFPYFYRLYTAHRLLIIIFLCCLLHEHHIRAVLCVQVTDHREKRGGMI
jgi:hypothetical protein